MCFIVVKDHHVVLEEVLNVLFSIQVQPVFKSESAERLEHLLLSKKVDLLRLLGVSFGVQPRELE